MTFRKQIEWFACAIVKADTSKISFIVTLKSIWIMTIMANESNDINNNSKCRPYIWTISHQMQSWKSQDQGTSGYYVKYVYSFANVRSHVTWSMQDMSVNYNTKLIRDVNFTSWVYGDYFLPWDLQPIVCSNNVYIVDIFVLFLYPWIFVLFLRLISILLLKSHYITWLSLTTC